MHLLATGRFLSLLAQSVLQSAAQKWPIKVLPIDLAGTTQPIAVVTLKHRALSPVAQRFIEELRAVAKSMPSQSRIS
jgi:DNA-binding transcriptional LysR family regulator